MKRLEPESIGDVLRQALSDQGLTERLYETRAIAAWPAVIGADLAACMGRPVVYRGVMTIYVANAALRQELNMNRSGLRDHINATVGRDVISDLRFR